MKVKLLTRWLAVSGKNPGDVVDLPDAQAQDGIARGICKKVGKGPEVDFKAENEQLKVRIAEIEQLKKLIADLETHIQQLTVRNETLEAQASGQTAEETKPATEKTGGKGKDTKSSSGKGKAK